MEWKCPRDSEALTIDVSAADSEGGKSAPRDADGAVHRCLTCKGAFLRDAALQVRVLQESISAAAASRPGWPAVLACCRCGGAMEARLLNGAEVDLCIPCGALWLDAGERDRLESAIDPRVLAGLMRVQSEVDDFGVIPHLFAMLEWGRRYR